MSAAGSVVVTAVFNESRNVVYTTTGYDNLHGHLHLKHCSVEDALCALFIRDAMLVPELN